MKHAILMTVYKDADLVNKLINLYPIDFDIFIHIDKKSKLKVQDFKQKNVKVFKKYKVNWGGTNHVLAMLFLLQEALKCQCDYYHIITGQDLPIKPATFDNRIKYGYSYLEYFKIPSERWTDGGLWRYEYFCLYDFLDAKKTIQNYLINKIIHIQKKLQIKRPFRNYSKLYGGSGYCSLYKDHAVIIIREADKYLNFYKHTFCAEESIFQTILINSSAKKHIFNDNLRYIDWNALIPPKILSKDDLPYITLNNLFCRKIDKIVSNELFEKLT